MKICHLITSLGSGGAERNLAELVNSQTGFDNIVVCLKKDSFYSDYIRKNCKIYFLDFKYNLSFFLEIIKVIKIIQKEKPKFIMAWMYHCIFLSILISIFQKCNIFWNIRHSNFHIKYTKFKTILIILLCSIFSHFIPKKIIYNSYSSKKIHQNFFYSKKKSIVINNGFKKFKLNKKRSKNFTISFIGRNNPQKNHKVFFKAINLLPVDLNIRFILIGKDIPKLKNEYIKFLNTKLKKKIKFYNERKNIFNFYKFFDINILPSSYGESFSNVVAETMGYGIPNITSDVGDNKKIIKNTGLVLSNYNSSTELSKKILVMYNLWSRKKKWEKLKKRCVERIRKHYNFKITLKKYVELLNDKN